MIALDLSKKKIADADPKAIQQIKFTGKLDRTEDRTTFFIPEEVKEINLNFSQETVGVL